MTRPFLLAAAVVCLSLNAGAQSPDEEVKRAIENANAAARRLDKAAYARFLADELQWISGATGVVLTKQQRLDRVTPTTTVPPQLSDVRIRVYGDVAVVTEMQTYTDGSQWRAARTLVKRDDRWQLLLHAQTKIAK